jgi:carbon-monoxide dehydrogenase small subunit
LPETVKRIDIDCIVNGERRHAQAFPMARLLDVLREEMNLTGTKEGCGEGECGACAVLVNGEIVNSCLMPAIDANGADIRTIEGIAQGDQLNAVQEAFLQCGGAQCDCLCRAIETASSSHRRGNSRRTCRKSLPLHGLPENFRSGGTRLRVNCQ